MKIPGTILMLGIVIMAGMPGFAKPEDLDGKPGSGVDRSRRTE